MWVSSNGNQFTVWILPIKGVREENGIYHLEVVAIDELPQFSSSPLNVDPKPHNGVKPYLKLFDSQYWSYCFNSVKFFQTKVNLLSAGKKIGGTNLKSPIKPCLSIQIRRFFVNGFYPTTPCFSMIYDLVKCHSIDAKVGGPEMSKA